MHLNLGKKIILMAVDGSMKHEQGGAGVVLKNDRGWITQISVPVDGNKCDTTSYRTALNAIYSGYLFLTKTSYPEKQSQYRGNIWSDSNSSLKKLATCQYVRPPSIKMSLEPKFPMISAINSIR